MNDFVVSSQALKECLNLSEEILKDIELSRCSMTNITLKTSRLARLIGHFSHQQIFLYEVGGYPSTPNGVSSEVWQFAKESGRVYLEKVGDETKELAALESLEQLELELEAARESLSVAQDVNISITSANPKQYVIPPANNSIERSNLRKLITKKSKTLSQRRAYIHNYVTDVHYKLKYSEISNDIFTRIRDKVDSKIGELIPDSVKKFTSVYENLHSENTENWSNAVHSCRRILQDLADAVYPSREDKVIEPNGKKRTIKLGPDNYVNRLIAYVEENSTSHRFEEIVGSHMKYLGERLDSIFKAAQKGSHNIIESQEEADRYVVYTYLIVGDILNLKDQTEKTKM